MYSSILDLPISDLSDKKPHLQMHASKPRQRKQLASPGLLTKKKEPFRITTVYAIAKALSEGQEEMNLKIGITL
jgi:hypothetical protein